MENTSGNRLQELDALRGIAAIAVVFFHYSMGHDETRFLFRFGVTGVDLFFIISGFVITMSLSKIKRGRDFVINRFARLYPTYWAAVTFTLFALYITKTIEHGQEFDIYWKEYFANLTMFQYYLNFQDIDGPYWTMIIEMVFYITMLVLFYVRALRFTIPVFVLLMALSVISAQFYGDAPFTTDLMRYFPLLQFIPLFLAGIVFYRFYTKSMNPWIAYVVLALCFVSQQLLFQTVGKSKSDVSQLEYVIILTIYFGFFILFLYHRLGFIVNRGTLFLGKISFALYLVHQYISIGFIIPALIRHGVHYFAACLVALPVAIGIATLITYYVEIPAGRKIRQLLRPRN